MYEDVTVDENYKEPSRCSADQAYENRLLPLWPVGYGTILRIWGRATRIPQEHQGILITLVLRRQARKLIEQIHISHRAWS